MLLRNAKNHNFLEAAHRSRNAYCICYETLRDNPIQVLNEFFEHFGKEVKSGLFFQPVDFYKGQKNCGKFVHKKYQPFSNKDLAWVNSQLDWEIEAIFGYKKKI
jgi:hypothetical protein